MTKFELYFDDDNGKFIAINPETGEIKDLILEKKKASTRKSSKKDEDSTPKVILEANKYTLNTAALELLNVKAGDRILINYVHGEPIIGSCSAFSLDSEAGNKLTKSGTIACRGRANETLAKYGSIFELEATDKEGQFKMKGDAPEAPTETEEIANPDDIDDIDDLVKDSTNFNFNFSF